MTSAALGIYRIITEFMLKEWHSEGMALQCSGVWSTVLAQTLRRTLLFSSAKIETTSSSEFLSGRAV